MWQGERWGAGNVNRFPGQGASDGRMGPYSGFGRRQVCSPLHLSTPRSATPLAKSIYLRVLPLQGRPRPRSWSAWRGSARPGGQSHRPCVDDLAVV